MQGACAGGSAILASGTACKDTYCLLLQGDHCGKVNDNEVWISMDVSPPCEVFHHILMGQEEISSLKF